MREHEEVENEGDAEADEGLGYEEVAHGLVGDVASASGHFANEVGPDG